MHTDLLQLTADLIAVPSESFAEGPLTDSIVVCHRDRENGRSLLTPLSELPGYAQALAEGTLGRAVTAGRLVDHGDQAPPDYSEFERLLGMT